MSRPVQSIKICNLEDLCAPQITIADVCVDIGGGQIVEGRVLILRDSATLAPLATRLEQPDGTAIAAGTIVDCNCDDPLVATVVCDELAAFPIVSPTSSMALVTGSCEKVTLADVSSLVGQQLVTDATFIDAVTAGIQPVDNGDGTITIGGMVLDICAVIANCDLASLVDFATLTQTQVNELLSMLDFSTLTATQSQQILSTLDFSMLSQAQVDALTTALRGQELVDAFGVSLGYLLN